jgi:hypothetical protein
MELKTASSVINYISTIEGQSADWYAHHARQDSDLEKLFAAFAAENKKFGKRLKKAYYSGVTDALETNFSFQGLKATVNIPDTVESASADQLLKRSLALETQIQSFYREAADLSRDLLADVTRAMDRLGRARDKRLGALQAMLEKR